MPSIFEKNVFREGVLCFRILEKSSFIAEFFFERYNRSAFAFCVKILSDVKSIIVGCEIVVYVILSGE